MQDDLKPPSPEPLRSIPLLVFVSSRYRVAVRVQNVFYWTSHTANSQLPRLFPESIVYTYGR